MPVVESLMILGAVVSLVHAVLWWRQRRDPTNLGLWLASVVYVLVLEPPLYFPDRFGLQDQVGLVFVHNLFSVQFLYDRLPLYIIAIYPALTYLVYALVQRTGVLERRNALIGAACVAFVFHCFYEIFDNLGPQFQWWAWNPAAPSNTPWLASVPLTSAVTFAGAAPFGIAVLTRILIARRAARGPIPAWSMALRIFGVGALTPLSMMVFSVPYGIVSLPDDPDVTAQSVVLWVEIAVIAIVALAAFQRIYQEHRRDSARVHGPDGGFLGHYPLVGGATFLLVFGVLWLAALPAYFDAAGGRTPSGTPTGSLGYVIVCTVVCLGVLALVAGSSAPTVMSDSREPRRRGSGRLRACIGRRSSASALSRRRTTVSTAGSSPPS
ncbi:MAG TPA: hypothetical protein VLL08_15425 [Kineosporiaceae bacterium]|nr:hypothetical protein [Kineosporiaceae bacterium]